MPIVSEFQRDRVALLLTLNVFVFVGYAAAVVVLLASPSVWMVTFLIVGLAYNVIELWQSAPSKQPPDVVRAHNKATSKRGAGEIAPQRLGYTHVTNSVLGARGTAVARESLAQRLAELKTSLPVEPSGTSEAGLPSLGQPAPLVAAEPVGPESAQVPAELRPNTETVLAEAGGIVQTSAPASTEGVPGVMVTRRVVAANAPELPVVPVAEPTALPEVSEKQSEFDHQPIDADDATLISPEQKKQTLAKAQAIEPRLETAAEEVVTASARLPMPEETVVVSVLKPESQPITHLAGRRQAVVDIVIASLASDTNDTQPASKPGSAQRTEPGKPRTASESLAMIRSELARSRGTAGATADAKAPVAPRKPLGAGRKPAKSPADGTRDRVMFVWHGRHFLAPIEGRHPLRVAQSLYDFMVEEEMEHA